MGRTIETTLDIAAPVQRVWSALTDFARIPDWSRFILAVDGEVKKGARLTVRVDDGGGPMTFRPELVVADAQQELRWVGTLGARVIFAGEHYFRMTALPDGGTRFTHGETFSGMLTPLLWKVLNTRTRRGFEDFNQALRARAEAAQA